MTNQGKESMSLEVALNTIVSNASDVKTDFGLDTNSGVSTLRKRFTEQEDTTLKHVIQELRIHNWEEAAKYMPGRTARQCRDRYNNYLFKEISNKPWTDEEDSIILSQYPIYGTHWVKISKFLVGRSGNNVKNRWYKFLSKHYNHNNHSSSMKTVTNNNTHNANNNIDQTCNINNNNHNIQREVQIMQQQKQIIAEQSEEMRFQSLQQKHQQQMQQLMQMHQLQQQQQQIQQQQLMQLQINEELKNNEILDKDALSIGLEMFGTSLEWELFPSSSEMIETYNCFF